MEFSSATKNKLSPKKLVRTRIVLNDCVSLVFVALIISIYSAVSLFNVDTVLFHVVVVVGVGCGGVT